MTWYEKIVTAHTAVSPNVSHSERLPASDCYFCWQEDGTHDLTADNSHSENAMTGYTDLFTKTEFDPLAGSLCASFDTYGIAYSLRGISYEEDTGFYHYIWDWEVV